MLRGLTTQYASNRGAIWRYVTSTASMSIGLVAHTVGFVILARSLGSEQFGKLTIITTIISLGLVWIGLGSGEFLRRQVARDRDAYPEALGHATALTLITNGIIGLVLIVGMSTFLDINPDPFVNFLVVVMFVVSNTLLFAIVSMTEVILLSFEKVQLANAVNAGSGIGRAIAAIAACYGFGVTTLESWSYWHMGYYLVTTAVCIIVLYPYGKPKLCIKRDELFRGFSVSITGLLVMLRQNADILALSAVVSPSVVGVYSVARRLVSTASVVSASLDRLVYSTLAVAGKEGPAATWPLAVKYAGYAVLLCIATSLTLYFAAPLIPFIFGEQYQDAIFTLQILCWVLVLTSLQWLASDALNAAEQHKPRLIAETVAGLTGAMVLVGMTLAYHMTGILVSVYVAGILVTIALWGTFYYLAKKQTMT